MSEAFPVLPEAEVAEQSASVREAIQKREDAAFTVTRASNMAGKFIDVVPSSNFLFSEEPGAYVFTGPEDIEASHDINFSIEERLVSGAADSAHAVIAGRLEVATGGRAEKTVIDVAAKCYQKKREFADRLERARREVTYMRLMKAAGEVTMEPIAVIVTPEELGSAIVLFTRFNDSLFTLDNAAWARGLTDMNVEAALKSAAAIGRFNAKIGLRHGDAKIKNFASADSELLSSSVSLIDYETAQPLDVDTPYSAGEAAHADLGLLLKSLVDKGFFKIDPLSATNNPPAVRDLIIKMCEDAYLPNWNDAAPEVQSAVYEAVVELAEQTVQEIIPQGLYTAV